LEQLADEADPTAAAKEFARLSWMARGNSQGWKFNRDEIYERRPNTDS
jgi:hypothetical protein